MSLAACFLNSAAAPTDALALFKVTGVRSKATASNIKGHRLSFVPSLNKDICRARVNMVHIAKPYPYFNPHRKIGPDSKSWQRYPASGCALQPHPHHVCRRLHEQEDSSDCKVFISSFLDRAVCGDQLQQRPLDWRVASWNQHTSPAINFEKCR